MDKFVISCGTLSSSQGAETISGQQKLHIPQITVSNMVLEISTSKFCRTSRKTKETDKILFEFCQILSSYSTFFPLIK